jgi:hypothetical protein
MGLVVHKIFNPIFFGEPLDEVIFVLPYTFEEFGGHTDI